MQQVGDDGDGQALEGEVLPAQPHPRLPKRIRLGTLREVRREQANVYVDARRGVISTADGAKLTYILDRQRQAIADDEFEDRLAAVERKLQEKP